MARIFVTGSADGLGQMAARLMLDSGHRVVLHARSRERAADALAALPGAETAVVGDLSSIEATCGVAEQVNGLGAFDAVIHNAGIGYREPATRRYRRMAFHRCLPSIRSRPTSSRCGSTDRRDSSMSVQECIEGLMPVWRI